MNNDSHFKNPPITEAIFDVKAVLSKDISLDKLLEYHEIVKDEFPNKQERRTLGGGFKFKAGVAPEIITPSDKVCGFLFQERNKKKIVQALMDGFTFHKLKPYSNWENFSLEAKQLWEKYCELVKPEKVTRWDLRYINRIDIQIGRAHV